MNLPTVEEILREKIHDALPHLSDGERAKFDRIVYSSGNNIWDAPFDDLRGYYNLIRRTLLLK